MRCLSFLFLCLGLATPAAAADCVDLELVLLADASGSIDDDEIRFQRLGYAQAITDDAVLRAIADTGFGRIAVTYVEWGDHLSQEVVVGWSIIDGPGAASDFAVALVEPPRLAHGRNAIGAALLAGKRLIEENTFVGARRIIDLSADSANNWNWPTIAAARAEVLAAAIVADGLPVLCRDCWSGRPVEYDLERAFADEIIGGPGSFVVTADGPASFAAAVRRKLIQEIAGGRSGDQPVLAAGE